MAIKRVCPYCKKTFTTRKNAKIFCKKKCSDLESKKNRKITKYHLCQWCAKRFHPSEYRTKFCSNACRSNFVGAVMVVHCKARKRKVKNSTAEIVRRSREAGLSYGVYVGINKLD